MTLDLSKLKTVNWGRVLFIGFITALVLVVAIACVNQYQDRRAAALQAQTEAKVKSDAYNKVVTQKELDHQALIDRLVSICMEAQQSYDKLTVKEKATRVRPDCTVVQ